MRTLITLLLLAGSVAAQQIGNPTTQDGVLPPRGTIAIRNAKIVTVSGPDIERGTIVIRDGKIEAVGANVSVPAGAQYVCVVEKDGRREQTTIQFGAKVAAMCQKHPEMGPCQYERNLCRRSGGRVYAAPGVEITMATEAEYDKKVMRVRFRAN